jgi:homoserine kinase type II
MAVYTHVSGADVEGLLSSYDLGALEALAPISAGLENSNYALTTSHGEYVLTLFEHHAADEVREFVRLARHLGNAGLQVPAPLINNNERWLHDLGHRPAILCQRFPGAHPQQLTVEHCRAIGAELARFHLHSKNLPNRRSDERGFDWWVSVASEYGRDLNQEDSELLRDEVAYQVAHRSEWMTLPHGWIHADLFHDNALFSESAELTAILDLYNACDGAWLYDLAIVANDWCVETGTSGLDSDKVEALAQAYRSVRDISAEEWSCWNLVLRGAALRFWLSRLLAARLATQRGESLPEDKQPSEYKLRLAHHRKQS